jgi:hypothetical protein
MIQDDVHQRVADARQMVSRLKELSQALDGPTVMIANAILRLCEAVELLAVEVTYR